MLKGVAMKKWFESRKEAIPFVLAILVAECLPLLLGKSLTQQQWNDYTIQVLVTVAIVAIAIGVANKFNKKK